MKNSVEKGNQRRCCAKYKNVIHPLYSINLVHDVMYFQQKNLLCSYLF